MERLAEEPVEHRPGGADLEGAPHLAEDLALAGDHRVEAGGDPEQVESGRLVGEPVDDAADLLLRQAAQVRERVERPALRVLADEVELGPVARREADGLAAVRELLRQLRSLRQRDEGTLAHRDRSGLVGESDEGEGHEKCVS